MENSSFNVLPDQPSPFRYEDKNVLFEIPIKHMELTRFLDCAMFYSKNQKLSLVVSKKKLFKSSDRDPETRVMVYEQVKGKLELVEEDVCCEANVKKIPKEKCFGTLCNQLEEHVRIENFKIVNHELILFYGTYSNKFFIWDCKNKMFQCSVVDDLLECGELSQIEVWKKSENIYQIVIAKYGITLMNYNTERNSMTISGLKTSNEGMVHSFAQFSENRLVYVGEKSVNLIEIEQKGNCYIEKKEIVSFDTEEVFRVKCFRFEESEYLVTLEMCDGDKTTVISFSKLEVGGKLCELPNPTLECQDLEDHFFVGNIVFLVPERCHSNGNDGEGGLFVRIGRVDMNRKGRMHSLGIINVENFEKLKVFEKKVILVVERAKISVFLASYLWREGISLKLGLVAKLKTCCFCDINIRVDLS